jgi:hypothetical protein
MSISTMNCATRAKMSAEQEHSLPAHLHQAARQICRELAENVIRRGLVNPDGKTDDQLRSEIFACLRREFSNRNSDSIRLVLDHTSALLSQARQFRNQEEYYLACLLYATWAEHWLNGLISTAGEWRKLCVEEITQIIRDTPLRSKLTWVLKLLGLPRIADRHRNAVIRLMDLRNGFVHYKWLGKPLDSDDQEEAEIKPAVVGFESTVKYLQTYQSRKIYARSRNRARTVI